jgi:hypothetical protein
MNLDMKEGNQTAVEWLFEKLWEEPRDKFTWYSILRKAKEIEKEQMEDAWIAAHQAGRFEGKGIAEEDWQTFFNYYNETYNVS